ncbi:MFS transporter [Saccharibacillus sp. CPCC 101409]|uniref:MFS transporter n=1 Tax=Saccharibacillus sp. CPCC 101409 TaxID=3058041 RepID=UPI002671054A|nr:MFS transporter [Saccharibacillus sp. CPCC 101409]MDO3411195.1 MFS transporter [Saccharibacillus sp. CPCC 101409]
MNDTHTRSSVRGNASFMRLWTARIFSTTAFQMLSVAIGWQMYALTGSAFQLGFVGLAQFLPMLLLTLPAGQTADRFDRRTIVYICQLLEAVVVVLLLLGSLRHWLDPAHILVAAAILGACRTFESPASAALVPDLVDKEQLPYAAAWSASAGQTAQIVGPSLGGVLVAIGPAYAYSVSLGALLLSVVLVFGVKVVRFVKKSDAVGMESFLSGLRFVFKRKIILGTISLDLFAVLLGGATALLPIFADDVLRTGPWGLGILRSAPAVGALVVSVILTRVSMQNSIGKMLIGSLAVFALATILFGVSTNIWLSLFALLLIGASDVVSVVIRSTLVQINTPQEMQGRVNAVNSLFIGTSNQLGEFESGTVAGLLGAVPATIIGGAGTLAVAVIWMFLFPMLRDLKTYEVVEDGR